MKLLTITIPTYDRPDSLRRTLPAFLTAIEPHKDKVGILLIDNGSEIPTADVIRPMLEEHPEVEVTVMRNRVNLGMQANIMRCFENCETPWMWLMGDDDLIREGALDTVLNGINEHPDCVFHNYVFNDWKRDAPYFSTGLDDFVHKIDYFPTILFMSVGIFRLDAFIPNLRYGYLYSYSWTPPIALILASLEEDKRVYFSTDALIDEPQLADRKNYWSVLNVFMGIPVLTDLPMKASSRRTLGKVLGAQLNLEQLPYHLIMNQRKDGDSEYALYTFDHIVYRNFYFGTSFVRRIKAFIYRLFVRFPSFGTFCIKTLYPLIARKAAKGKSIEEITVPDRWGRV